MNNSSIVYWGLFVEPNKFAERALLTEEPKRLIADLKDIYNQESFAFRCPSIKDKHLNTFVYKLPFDVTVSTMGGTGFYTQHDNVLQRISMYKEASSFEIRYQLIFYSFDDLIFETSPAYFHQTSYSSLGHLPSGSFNIGKWFRPFAPNVSMFPNVDVFRAVRGEPLCYFNFITDKKIVLKQFYMNEFLMNTASNFVEHKNFKPFEPLQDLYNKASKAKIHKVIKKEILNNLLD